MQIYKTSLDLKSGQDMAGVATTEEQVETPKPPRPVITRWLSWLAGIGVVVVVVIVGIMIAGDSATGELPADMQAVAQSYAGDLVFIPATPLPAELQATLDSISASYASDIAPTAIGPDNPFWFQGIASSYAGDIDPGLDADYHALLERLTEVAASYAGDIAPTG